MAQLTNIKEQLRMLPSGADHSVDQLLDSCSPREIAFLLEDAEVSKRIVGTLRLLDPNEMRAALGTCKNVALHLSLVAIRMLHSDEFTRDDVIHYLAGCFINLGAEFGGDALEEFFEGAVDTSIFPLEVLEHVVELEPRFSSETTICPFLRGRSVRAAQAGVPLLLQCDPATEISDFAIKGGAPEGSWEFAGEETEGHYRLVLHLPGQHKVLLCAEDQYGFERIQRLTIAIEKAKEPTPVGAIEAEGNQAEAHQLQAHRTEDHQAEEKTDSLNQPTLEKPKKKKKKKKKKRPLEATAPPQLEQTQLEQELQAADPMLQVLGMAKQQAKDAGAPKNPSVQKKKKKKKKARLPDSD